MKVSSTRVAARRDGPRVKRFHTRGGSTTVLRPAADAKNAAVVEPVDSDSASRVARSDVPVSGRQR